MNFRVGPATTSAPGDETKDEVDWNEAHLRPLNCLAPHAPSFCPDDEFNDEVMEVP